MKTDIFNLWIFFLKIKLVRGSNVKEKTDILIAKWGGHTLASEEIETTKQKATTQPKASIILIVFCTDQVIGCDDVDKRKVGGQEVNVVAVCRSGVLQYK